MTKLVSGETFLSAAQLSARDRRYAAVHEAGHVVIGRHLEIATLRAEIRKIDPQDLTEKEWIGSVQCSAEGVVLSKLQLIAVAGLVAEACWKGEAFVNLYEELHDDPEAMSQSDWELSGCLPGEPSEQFWDAVEQAFGLLNRETGQLWNALLVEARGLIASSRRDAALTHPKKIGSSGLSP
jgi:hypothetical protein